MATKKTTEKPEVVEEVKVKKPDIDPMEEYVEITLFKDNERYKSDVYVCVNGENCIIQRGVPVKVKRKFVEVLRNSERQRENSANIISELTR